MKAKQLKIPIYWENHFNAWKKTSLSQVSYCQQYQLKEHQFSYYKRRQIELKNRHSPNDTGFIKLNVKPQPTQPIKHSSLCLHLSKKQSIEGITSETIHLVQPLLACLA